MKKFATLIEYLDYCLRLAQDPAYDAKTFYNQAFGAVQYHAYLDLDGSVELNDLWNEVYRPKFEKAVYGE